MNERQIEIKEEQSELMTEISNLCDKIAELNSELPEDDKAALMFLGNIHKHEFEEQGVTGDHSKCRYVADCMGTDDGIRSLLLHLFLKNPRFHVLAVNAVRRFEEIVLSKFLKGGN